MTKLKKRKRKGGGGKDTTFASRHALAHSWLTTQLWENGSHPAKITEQFVF